MRPALRVVAVAALLAISPARSGAVDESAQQEARRLTEAAMEIHDRAEKMEQGWAEAHDEGIALAEKAMALDPESADAHYALFVNLGSKSERTGLAAQMANIGRLREVLARTLELDPEHAHGWEATGELLMRLPWVMGGSDEKGVEALRRSAELAPRWPKPHLRLAQFHWRKGDGERARAAAIRARELVRAGGDSRWLAETEQLLREIELASR